MIRCGSSCPSVFVLLASLALVYPAVAEEYTPRQPLSNVPLVTQAEARSSVLGQRLVVKFTDEAQVRVRNGELDSLSGAQLATVRGLIESAQVAPLIQLPEETLSALEARAARRSGRMQPDLAGLIVVDVPRDRRYAVGEALRDLPIVEFAYLEDLGIEPPGDIAPLTPEHTGEQDYRGPDPGIDAERAAAMGFTGAGVRLSDCEYGWVSEHEDLVDLGIVWEPGQTVPGWVISLGFDEHGTAVLGETSSFANGYGVSGMASGANVHVFPEWSVEEGSRRVTSVTNAIATSSAGDVVLLEMQDGAFAPAEVDPGVWTAVKTGTDAGVVVVAAAGNGDQNLDGDFYEEYRSRGDSGAIIVGAGSANTRHDKLSFSTHGERVDVHGWGENVFTLGYGDFAEYGNDKNQRYTAAFSGTSSASPFVASAALVAQEAVEATWGVRLSSQQMRDLLRETGLPQGTGNHIGPFVQAGDAVDQVLAGVDLELVGDCGGTLDLSISGATPNTDLAVLFSETAGSSNLAGGPCAEAGIDLEDASFLTKLTADGSGSLDLSVPLPATRCGVFLEIVDLTTCGSSSAVATPQ